MAKHSINVCIGTTCCLNRTADGKRMSEKLYEEIKKRLKDKEVVLSYCYCFGHCERGNNISIDGKVFNFVGPQDLDRILEKHIERPDDLAKSGLTPAELESILFPRD